MKHSLPKYLEDARLSILDIERYVEQIGSYHEIEENQILFDALCRRFAIIGEALYHAHKLDKNLNITDLIKIKGLRHIIVHDYDVVRASDLWSIITKKLSTLKTEVEALLKNFE